MRKWEVGSSSPPVRKWEVKTTSPQVKPRERVNKWEAPRVVVEGVREEGFARGLERGREEGAQRREGTNVDGKFTLLDQLQTMRY